MSGHITAAATQAAMTTGTGGSGVPSGTQPAGSGASGLARRLHPYDGLYLRSVHLDAIEDFGLDRQLRANRAGGAGVVEGLGVALVEADNQATIGRGYGIDPQGRLVCLDGALRANLPDPNGPDAVSESDTSQHTVWLLTLEPVSWYEGTDEVYSDICGRSCDPGSGQLASPFIAEGAMPTWTPFTLQLRYPDRSDLAAHLRNRIVSAWFDREQLGLSALPAALRSVSAWSTPPPAPTGTGVALALVWHDADGWHLDTWAARRERIEPGGRAGLEHRFGQRPWAVFAAQISQFQEQLAASWRSGITTPADIGIVEVPPAGFVPMPKSWEDSVPSPWELEKLVTSVLSPVGLMRFCYCDADQATAAVAAAQHRARIDLTDSASRIDVYVPVTQPDGWTTTTSLGWLAFARTSECLGDYGWDQRRDSQRPTPPDEGGNDPV